MSMKFISLRIYTYIKAKQSYQDCHVQFQTIRITTIVCYKIDRIFLQTHDSINSVKCLILYYFLYHFIKTYIIILFYTYNNNPA